MTTNPRFLALVAKVDEDCKRLREITSAVFDTPEILGRWYRALKGEIMRHEPDEDGDCSGCGLTNMEEGHAWPCKPFSDMEAEVGK